MVLLWKFCYFGLSLSLLNRKVTFSFLGTDKVTLPKRAVFNSGRLFDRRPLPQISWSLELQIGKYLLCRLTRYGTFRSDSIWIWADGWRKLGADFVFGPDVSCSVSEKVVECFISKTVGNSDMCLLKWVNEDKWVEVEATRPCPVSPLLTWCECSSSNHPLVVEVIQRCKSPVLLVMCWKWLSAYIHRGGW